MYQKILVPVDGSDPSNCGLREAINLAKDLKSHIRLLNVVDEHVLDAEYCIGTYEGDMVDARREVSIKVLHDASALVSQFGLESDSVSVESKAGRAAPLIVAQAAEWGAQLIVMGTHGRRGLKRLAMGSDAETVVRGTRIPVLLVHEQDPPQLLQRRGAPVLL